MGGLIFLSLETRGTMIERTQLEPVTIEHEELRGIARTVAELEWLLLILVLLYQVFAEPEPVVRAALSAAMFFFTAMILSFRYANFYRTESRWKIAVETCAMTVFITWALWFTGKLASPLLNTYLMVIITSALALGKLATVVEMALIFVCVLLLGDFTSADGSFSVHQIGGIVVQLAPVILIAYITTMFSADIHYGLNRVRLLSETDELTGIYNRRGFATLGGRLFSQAIRYGHPSTVMLIDLDAFKEINDQYGHEAGDQVLRQVAAYIQTELRITDVLARYGGDEFIVLLPETPSRAAIDVGERIRKAVAASPIEFSGHSIATTVSIGVAAYPESGGALDTLIGRADRAMYEVKQAGRNGVVVVQKRP
jgi:diguanylate cyclase (GGDEF)-like protein